MTNYSTISDGNASNIRSAGDMSRPRRRGHKDGGHGGQATTISSVVNLLNTIVGAGTLAMPSVMSHMGIMLGVVLILWSGLTAAFGLYLQSRCARYLDRGTSSFFALSQITYPNAAVIFDAAIAIKCFGVGVSYMIIIGDLMPGVVLGFLNTANSAPYLVDRNFWITAFMLLIIPLSFLRRLDSLKYTSIVALVSIGYLIVLVIYHFASDKHADPGSIRVIQWGGAIETLSALPVVVFAYTCHQNMFSILNELKDNSPSSIIGVVGSSIGSAASIYVVVAITGYLTFGNAVVGNIVSMYPTGAASTIGKAAIVVLVTFSVPLQVHPCRASLDAVLKWRPNRGSSNNGRTAAPLLPTPPAGDHGSIAPISDLRFAVITTFILTFAYMTALSVTSLDRVLAFVGSTGSTSISFILPGLFYYKISNPDSIHHQRLAKEDDDIDEDSATSDVEDSAALAQSTASVRSGVSVASNASTRSNRNSWRWRRKWRWDLEHIEPHHLRRLALALAIYGSVIMTTGYWVALQYNYNSDK
ncbi:transmembrane amino acid transporter protein-domain-containing protein [Fusarium avenaceum]|nr:transmembrane amino acid transporter protein-domain-containing protein [Fusarium avenaceum]